MNLFRSFVYRLGSLSYGQTHKVCEVRCCIDIFLCCKIKFFTIFLLSVLIGFPFILQSQLSWLHRGTSLLLTSFRVYLRLLGLCTLLSLWLDLFANTLTPRCNTVNLYVWFLNHVLQPILNGKSNLPILIIETIGSFYR